jgi:hypothetical protein
MRRKSCCLSLPKEPGAAGEAAANGSVLGKR